MTIFTCTLWGQDKGLKGPETSTVEVTTLAMSSYKQCPPHERGSETSTTEFTNVSMYMERYLPFAIIQCN